MVKTKFSYRYKFLTLKVLLFRSKRPPAPNVRTRKHNIVLHLPGLIGPAKNIEDNPNPEDLWNLLFTEEMLNEIIHWTNVKIHQCRLKYKDSTHYSLKDIDLLEMKAFLGLLIYTEVFKSGNENVDCLFATDGTGRDVFRCTMSKRRFETFLACLRFDNFANRQERKEVDGSAAIADLFQRFIEHCQRNFSLGAYVCVDESLVAFKGRCRFRMYMPKKPAKYGIKLMCLTDARNNYLYNAYVYSGKDSDGRTLSAEERRLKIPTQAVLRLVKPIEKTNRNVTADNWFGSIELVTELQKRGLTFLGTLKQNKPDIPSCFLPNKNRENLSSLYGFNEDITLISYVPKPNKAVVLISSMHHSSNIDPETGKPEIIADYNLTKGGVDSLDRKCANYSPSRRTRRWPMAIFFYMLNMSTVNAYILYNSCKNRKELERKDFLKQLAKSLTIPYMQQRFLNGSKLPKELYSRMKGILQISDDDLNQSHQEPNDERMTIKKTCYQCSYKLKRKTFYCCRECEKPICLDHTRKICYPCLQKRSK